MIEELKIDCAKVKSELTAFIKSQTVSKGFKRVVLGLSGGVDSALVAALSAEALGKENVLAFHLPYRTTHQDHITDAEILAEHLEIYFEVIDISPMIDAYFSDVKTDDLLRKGNKMARERMSVLYDMSSKHKALVIGAGNRTERLLGYFTLYGDSAHAFNPIAGLYKCQVYQMAGYLDLPKSVLEKPPSAGLWSGQRDEEEIGLSYDVLDRFLYYKIDMSCDNGALERMGFSGDVIETLTRRIESNAFKLNLPSIPPL